ncbi:MAG: CSLREA domain-containing protein, partial [Anaerolineales bacterium]|nr:CSLREA domain-containing protein [Anaerolineales bacterium]
MKHRFFLIAPVFLSIFLFSMMHVLISHANPDISSNNLIVNSIADVTDANPGDGICETSPGNAICTLRAAIQEANALPGEDTIQLPAGTYTLTSGELAITDNVTIIGED